MVDTKDYIKYIRSNGCRVCGQFPVDPDHLEARGMGGAGKGGTVTNTLKTLAVYHSAVFTTQKEAVLEMKSLRENIKLTSGKMLLDY